MRPSGTSSQSRMLARRGSFRQSPVQELRTALSASTETSWDWISDADAGAAQGVAAAGSSGQWWRGIARGHLPADRRPAPDPEPREVAGDLDRPPGGGEHLHRDRDPTVRDRWVDGGAVEVLGAHCDPRMLTVVGDRGALAAGEEDRVRHESVELGDPATEAGTDDAGHVDALEVRSARRSPEKWGEPRANVGSERIVGARRPSLTEGGPCPPDACLEDSRRT